MPELPDVAVFKQYFDRTSLHQPIEGVEVFDEAILEDISPNRLSRHLEDRSFQRTRRRGKHLFAQVDDTDWLAVHFGMTGKLEYYKRREKPPDYTRLSIDFENGYHLAYVCPRKFGRISLTESPDAFIEERDLGPDALDIELRDLQERLEKRTGMLKAALMNQKILAGVGNIYSNEILFQLHLHPKTRVNDLDEDTLRDLHRTMRRVLRVAINHDADPKDLPDHYLLPHRYGDGRCPRCRGEIERIKVSGRSAYYCPGCQPEP